MARSTAVYRFGPYELHTRAREVYKGGTKLKLRPQPFHVLQLLADRAGEVVTREEFQELLWSQETFVDFEQGLNSAIKELRSVLNDSASNPRYIETLPKLGYRLVAPVTVREVAEALSAPAPQPEADKEESRVREAVFVERRKPAPRSWSWWHAAAILIALVIAIVGYQQWKRSHIPPQVATNRIMLAVLPFENLTGDAGQEYFSDGLTEEMIAQLGRLDPQHLGVIARTSVMRYKHERVEMGKIGDELGVQYALEGSVRRDAGKVRISAQLIQIKDQSHVWSREYDRELNNLLLLQSEIAQEIAGEILITLDKKKHGEPVRAPALSPNSYEAYDLYLKGLYFWNKRTSDGFQRAVDYFQQAVKKDPRYARAYAALADSYVLMSGYAGLPPKELIQKARTAAQTAIELDETLAEAHTATAVVAQDFEWDWKTAEREYRRAIELDPNYATAHHWYAEYLALMGRFDEAFVEIERARQLDPLSLIIAADHGVILYYSREYDRAIEQFRAVLEMDPHFPRAALLYVIYARKGMYAESLAGLKEWPGSSPWIWANLAGIYNRSGRPKEAKHAFRQLQKMDRVQQMDPVVFVVASIGMNQEDQAIRYLEKAYDEHSPALSALKVDPLYDSLRSDPRFKEIIRKMRLPE